MIQLDKILFPTDFSDSSNNALLYAVSLAEEYKAKLFLLHVIEDISNAAYFDMLTAPPLDDMYGEMEKQAWEQLNASIPEKKREVIKWEPLVHRGMPALEIVHTAEELEVGLIVLGTHGRSGLKHMIFGSVAEKVVRMAPCPVLTVRLPEHKVDLPERGNGGPINLDQGGTSA